jgi:hypothetical protein
VRATTVFNKIAAPLRVTATDVVFEGDILVLSIRAARRRLRCVCGWSTPSSYDSSGAGGGISISRERKCSWKRRSGAWRAGRASGS